MFSPLYVVEMANYVTVYLEYDVPIYSAFNYKYYEVALKKKKNFTFLK